MLSTPHSSAKEYHERGVQTDSDPTKASSSVSPSLSMDPPSLKQSDDASDNIGIQATSGSALVDPSGLSTQDDSAYMQDSTDFSFESTDDANQSMTTTTRTYNIAQLPANRPTTLMNRQPSSRVISLPEATPAFRMRRVLEKKKGRVSLPSATPRDTSIDTHESTGDPFVSDDEERSRVRVRSHATDVPHTPSTPSSPDSVVIIANNSNQLSSVFLRQRAEEEPPESDDEGM